MSAAVAVAAAALVYDPSALAIDPKRTLLLAVGLLLAARQVASGAPLRLGAAGGCWLALVVWSAITLAWGSAHGLRELSLWAAMVPLLTLLRALPADRMSAQAEVASLLLVVGTSLLALLGWPHAGHGNPDWAALVLAANLPRVVAWARTEPRRRHAALLWSAVVLGGGALVVCRSRTAWLAVIVAAFVATRLHRTARVAFLAMAIGICATARLALQGRLWIWTQSLVVAERALPFGVGLGDFPGAFLRAQATALTPLSPGEAAHRFVYATTAHHDWLQLLAEGGLPALGLLVAAFALAWRGATRVDRATLAAIGVAGLADTPLRQAGVLVPLLFVFAGAARQAAVVPRAPQRPSHALLLVALAPLFAVSIAAWLGARAAAVARDQEPHQRAVSLEVAAVIDSRSGEIACALGIARAELGDPEGAILALERSRALLPSVGVEVALGNAHAAAGHPGAAATAYERALWFNPGSFRARINLAGLEVDRGRLDRARAALAIARALLPGHPAVQAVASRLPPPSSRTSLGAMPVAASSASSFWRAGVELALTFLPRISSFLSECSQPASSVTVTE